MALELPRSFSCSCATFVRETILRNYLTADIVLSKVAKMSFLFNRWDMVTGIT